MVPRTFVALDRLPLTPNGKLDRAALPEPESGRTGAEVSYLAPRDQLELRLALIWEDLLKVQPIGVRDDFFALGGHSLLAVRLMARLRASLGRDLPLSALFTASTVESLASLLRRQAPVPPRRALVEIRRGGDLPPLFCVHPVGGEVMSYVDLARGLDAAQPVYGLQVPDVAAGGAPLTRIEDMAVRYLDEVRSVQAHGPYRLAGWSMGGVVAFEMARQLVAHGEEVALLAVVDAFAPSPGVVDEDELGSIGEFARDLWGVAGRGSAVAPEEIAGLAGDDLLRFLVERARGEGVLPPDVDFEQVRRSFAVFTANRRAMRSYEGRPYPGRILLVRAETPIYAVPADAALGWREVAGGGVDLCYSPGDHFTMVRPPNSGYLAALIAARLDRSRAAVGEPPAE